MLILGKIYHIIMGIKGFTNYHHPFRPNKPLFPGGWHWGVPLDSHDLNSTIIVQLLESDLFDPFDSSNGGHLNPEKVTNTGPNKVTTSRFGIIVYHGNSVQVPTNHFNLP